MSVIHRWNNTKWEDDIQNYLKNHTLYIKGMSGALSATRDMQVHLIRGEVMSENIDPQVSEMPFKEFIASDKSDSWATAGLDRNARRVRYKFPNGYGASVIMGDLFYCSEAKPYELCPLYEGALMYHAIDPENRDVYGYLDDGDLLIILAKLIALPTPTKGEVK